MRSRLIMNFMQARSSRASCGLDFGDGEWLQRCRFPCRSASSSRSRWRREFSKVAGAGGNAFGGSASGFLGEMTGFDGAPDNVMMRRFRG